MSGGILSEIKRWGNDLLRIFFPPVCHVCGKPLVEGECIICLECDMKMPRTMYHADPDNPLYYKLIGHSRLERATAMFGYVRENPYAALITRAKYDGHPEIVDNLAERYARELLPAGFFDGIDLLQPVPMFRWKKVKRGYNQAEIIADAISRVSGIGVGNLLVARSHTSQTKKSSYQRLLNARNIYSAVPEAIKDPGLQHVLLIDDVITTGATIVSCCEALYRERPTMKISVLTLAATQSF